MPSFAQTINVLPDILFILPFSGLLFCSLLALIFQLAEGVSGRVMYNHLARQSLQCVIFCVILGVLCLLVFPRIGRMPGLAFSDQELLMLGSGGLPLSYLPYILAAFTAFCGLHAGLCLLVWKKTRSMQIIQFLLTLFGVCLALLVSFLLFVTAPPLVTPFTHVIFLLTMGTGQALPALLLAAALLSGTFCLAVSLLGCWLLLRRNRDDFGRDYYNFALTRCGFSGCLVSAASLLCLGFSTFMQQDFLRNGSLGLEFLLAGAGLLAVSLAIWLVTARSRSPLRHKPGLWLTLPMIILSLAMLFMLSYQYLILYASVNQNP